MIIPIDNTLDRVSQFTYLSQNITAGGTVLPVKNINGPSPSWAVQVGATGDESAEIKVLAPTAISGTAFNTTGTVTYPHGQDTPVFYIKYDKLIIKRSTTGTAGTATAIATISITPDSLQTAYDDTTGAATYAYKSAYYNSVTGESSSDSDWSVPGGPNLYILSRIRDRIKRKLPTSNYISDNSVIDDWINEWGEEMNNAAVHVNKDYNLGTVDVAYGTAGYGTITSADFKQAVKLEITTDGRYFTKTTQVPNNQIYTTKLYNFFSPVHYYLGDSIFGIKPDGVSGTARITYARLYTQLTNDSDALPVSMQGYSKSFVDYGMAQALYLDQKWAEGDRYMAAAQAAKSQFISDITPRDQTGVKYIEIIDSLSNDILYSDPVL